MAEGAAPSISFRTKVRTVPGRSVTGIEVPAELVEQLGAGKRPKVRVAINGYEYRSSIGSMDGRFMIGVSADVREKANVSGGDTIDVKVTLDTAPRVVDVPPDLARAIAGDRRAKIFFESLSYSRKQRIVLAVEGAKTEETRQRRIAGAIEALREGKA